MLTIQTPDPPKPTAEGTWNVPPPPGRCPSVSPTSRYGPGNLAAETKRKQKFPFPKGLGKTCGESDSNTLPCESVDETFPCAGCPICLVHLQAEIFCL